MKLKYLCLAVSVVGLLSSGCATTEIASTTSQNKGVQQMATLSQQQQAIIPIVAFAATGEIKSLNQTLNTGLDQGLTINEAKAALVQVYAYAGFPRSLNALSELMKVVEQRKQKGVQDIEGKASTVLPQDYQSLVQGTQNQTKLVGQPVKGALFEFAPEIDEYLKAHLFGDIFSRDVLGWQDRELATVSMLAAMTGTEGQLKSHVQMSLNIGITPDQLHQVQQVLTEQVSSEAGQNLALVLSETK